MTPKVDFFEKSIVSLTSFARQSINFCTHLQFLVDTYTLTDEETIKQKEVGH